MARYRKRGRAAAVAVSIIGYTRLIDLSATAPASGNTVLVTQDVDDVRNGDPAQPQAETVNRKILRVGGQAFFSAGVGQDSHVVAQFCLRAAPGLDDWPTVVDYDPFQDGPGEQAWQGSASPRPFCRRTFVFGVADSSAAATQVIEEQHMIRSKAERLLRPGWKLQAGLYVAGSQGVKVRWTGLLRSVVAG